MSRTSTDYCFPKDYFRIVSRFLKEVGLYGYWIRFLHSSPYKRIRGFNGRSTDWNRSDIDYSVVNVLGKTNFTDYLKYCCGVELPVCTYELLAAFMLEYYPNHLTQKDIRDAIGEKNYLHIDKERKKTKIIFY